jgi:hypothetical protein
VKFPVRLVSLARDAIALNDHLGFDGMKAKIAARAGGSYEVELAELFLAHCSQLMSGLDGLSIERPSLRWSPHLTQCSTKPRAKRPIWRSPI